MDSQYVDEIIHHWGCRQSAYPNERSFCYIVGHTHLRLLAQHMKLYSIAINKLKGNIDTMLAALAKTLMPAKMGIKNPFRDNGAKALAKAASLNPSLSSASVSTLVPMPYY